MNAIHAIVVTALPGVAIFVGGIGWATGASWGAPVVFGGIAAIAVATISFVRLGLAGRREQPEHKKIYGTIDRKMRNLR
jgi:hypothetical protein